MRLLLLGAAGVAAYLYLTQPGLRMSGGGGGGGSFGTYTGSAGSVAKGAAGAAAGILN